MAGFTSVFSSSGSDKAEAAPQRLSAAEVKRQMQEQISQELAVNNATELVNKITYNCFEKCVPNPGSSLSPAEQTCTSQCMYKYMAAWNLVSRTYIARIQQASASGQI